MACENAINATDLLRDEIASLSTPRGVALARREGGVREHRRRPHRARPGGRCRTRRDGRDVLRVGDRASPVRRRAPDDPRRALRRRPRAVHRAEAVHREHGPRRDRLPRVPRRVTSASATRSPTPPSRRPSNGCWARPRRSSSPSTTSPRRSRPATAPTILERFRNPELPDTVERVGRQPLRKLGRHERFIGPGGRARRRWGCPSRGSSPRSAPPCDSTFRPIPRASSCASCSAPGSPPRSCTRSRASRAGHPLEPGLVAVVTAAQQAR